MTDPLAIDCPCCMVVAGARCRHNRKPVDTPHPERTMPAFTVTCPVCGAWAGWPCSPAVGRPRREGRAWCHAERKVAAEVADNAA